MKATATTRQNTTTEQTTVQRDFLQQEEQDSTVSEEYMSDQCNNHSFHFFRPLRRNVLDDTHVSIRLTRKEIEEETGVPDKWTDSEPEIKAYIDDLNIIEKIRHSDAISHITTKKQQKNIHAPGSENLFKAISSRASDLGMKVNAQKTQVLCISAAKSADMKSYIDTEEERIQSSDQLKILGFLFDGRPGVELHITKMEEKFRSRLWALRHLKRSGMPVNDILFIYKLCVRPV